MSRYTQEYDEDRQSRYYGSALTLVSSGLTLLGGLAIGAGLMYLLDPDEGPDRRKYIRRSASGALHSAGDVLGSAYGTVADSASSLRDRAGDLTESAGRYLRRSRDTARDYVAEYTEEDEGLGAGTVLSLVLGGSALAAVLYMLTTEYDSIRRGDLRGAASHAYHRASDAVGQVVDRASEYVSYGQQQGQTQQA
jgi:hypothetical protein